MAPAAASAKPSTAAELPEGRLAKQQIDRGVFGRWCGQLRHGGHTEIAERLRRGAKGVEDHHHPGDVVGLELPFGLDQPFSNQRLEKAVRNLTG